MYNNYLEIPANRGVDAAARWLINNVPDYTEEMYD